MVRKLWFCIPLLWLTLATGAAQTETVIVRPKVIDEVLVNPGMGIQTFQRFNGQTSLPPPSPIAAGSGKSWSRNTARSAGKSSIRHWRRRVRTGRLWTSV